METTQLSAQPRAAHEAVEVTIEGQKYAIRSDRGVDEIRRLAAYVDRVMQDIRKKTPTVAPTRVAILAALNIAEELFRALETSADVAERCSELMELIDRKLTPRNEETSMDAAVAE